MAQKKAKTATKETQEAAPEKTTHWWLVIGGLVVVLAVGIIVGRSSLTTYCKSLAQKRIDRYEYTEALECLEFIEEWGLDDADSHFLKARIYRKIGKFSDFDKSLAEARVKGLPESKMKNEKLLMMGQSGNVGELLGSLEELVGGVDQYDPPEVYEALLNGLLLNSRFAEAMEYLDYWEKDYPDDPNQKFYKASLLKRYGPSRNIKDAFVQASAILEDVTDKYPRHFRALLIHGELLMELNKVEDAVKQYEKCINNPDAGSLAAVSLAKGYTELGRQKEAIELYRSALKQEPENSIAQIELGKLLFNDEQFEEALIHLEQAYPKRPWDYDVAFSLARTLQALGRNEEAKKLTARALELQQKQGEIQALIAEVDVIRDEEKRYKLGKLILEYGNPETAVLYLKSVLDVNPGHQGAKEALAKYYAEKSRKSSNVSLFRLPLK